MPIPMTMRSSWDWRRSRLPALRILVEHFAIGKTSSEYLAPNASTEMEDLGQTHLLATSNSQTWLNAARNNSCHGRARHECGKKISAAIRTMRCATLRSICGAYSSTTAHATWPSAGDVRRGLSPGQNCSVNSTERSSLGGRADA
jgi:hypothetical protein